MSINKKVVGVGLVAGLLFAGAAGSYYVDSQAAKEFGKNATEAGMTYSKISCNVLFGNSCTMKDYKQEATGITADTVKIVGIKDFAQFQESQSIRGKFNQVIEVENMKSNSGDILSMFSPKEISGLTEIVGEKNVEILRKNGVNGTISVSSDLQDNKTGLALNMDAGIKDFPVKIAFGFDSHIDMSADQIEQSTKEMGVVGLLGLVDYISLNSLSFSFEQSNGITKKAAHGAYMLLAKDSEISSPEKWAAYNSEMVRSGYLDGKLSTKKSAISEDELADWILKTFKDPNNQITKELTKGFPKYQKEAQLIVKKLMDDDSKIELKVTNIGNLKFSQLGNFTTRRGDVNIPFIEKNLKIELL